LGKAEGAGASADASMLGHGDQNDQVTHGREQSPVGVQISHISHGMTSIHNWWLP
jgi:hypothetical protein